MPDPVSRLQLAREEIDKLFGDGYAPAHPELVAIVVQIAAGGAPGRKRSMGGGRPRTSRCRTGPALCARTGWCGRERAAADQRHARSGEGLRRPRSRPADADRGAVV
jgi:hypothetical protein